MNRFYLQHVRIGTGLSTCGYHVSQSCIEFPPMLLDASAYPPLDSIYELLLLVRVATFQRVFYYKIKIAEYFFYMFFYYNLIFFLLNHRFIIYHRQICNLNDVVSALKACFYLYKNLNCLKL